MIGFKIAFVIASAIIALFHIGSVVFEKKLSQILSYVNLALHIVLLFILMALEVSFEFMALCFMVSLLIYLFSSYLSYKIQRRRVKRDDL